jgi:hypothetical protein
VLQVAAGLVEDLTERHGDLLQIGKQAFVFGGMQGGKKMVLAG